MHLRIRRAIVAALACASTAVALAPSSASASFGWQYWGGFTVEVHGVPIGIPGGSMPHSITGTGTYVEEEWASFFAAGNVCNWRIDFAYSDVGNNTYEINRGALNSSCTHSSTRTIFPRQHKRAGKACAELYSNNVLVARQCHYITTS
jgi:hypothetical protein